MKTIKINFNKIDKNAPVATNGQYHNRSRRQKRKTNKTIGI